MRPKRFVNLIVLLALGFPPAAGSDLYEAETLVLALFEGLDAKRIDCPEALSSEQGITVACASYGSSFSKFKFDWEQQLQRFAFSNIKPRGGWSLKSGVYQKQHVLEGDPLVVSFEDASRRLSISYEDAETAPKLARSESAKAAMKDNDEKKTAAEGTATYDGPFFSGLAGATRPVLFKNSTVSPVYPEQAERHRLEGSVVLEAYVLQNGSVGRIEVMSAEPRGQGFEQAAIAALKQWRFEPGAREGGPVDVFFTLVFEFKLEP